MATPLMAAAMSCQSEQPLEAGGLVLNLESDLTMPKDIDAVSVVVTSESGETLLNEHYSLGSGAGRHLLPYQVRVDSKGVAARVKAQVIALKHGVARMERSADVDLPMQRWGAISLPVNYLCDGTVDQTSSGTGVSSSCGAGQTCDQGRCIASTVADVPDHIAADGGGGGAGISLAELSKDDNCLNVIDCMSDGLTVEVDTSTCSFDVPVNASGFLNVALKMAQAVDGFCGPKGCWLPLKFGQVGGGGWTTNGTTVFLPPAVCFEDPASARFQVTVSDACQTLGQSLALCGVAAAAAAKDDALATAAASTTAAVSAAALATKCFGPASRPCPSCGRQTRTCDAKTGTWSKWSECKGGGECALGEFVLNSCPGGLPQVCGPTCEWIPCCNPATCFGGRCAGGVCCGNGVIEGDETCEGGDCTTAAQCDDGIACTKDTYTGSVATCRSKCTHTPVIADGDGCCAPGVGPSADSDCQAALCGNKKVDLGESCDGDCPSDVALDCDDGIACTRDTIADLGTCRARCRHTPVRDDMDKCCAPGQTAADDADCRCGNGAIDKGEFCDGDCPTKVDCNDNNPCTADSLMGSAKDCSAHCVNAPIVVAGDSCCAPGQTHDTDPDCQIKAGCGNGVIEMGETCDGNCPKAADCVDMSPLACIEDVYEGSPDKCNARCVRKITRMNGDGCCPGVEPGKPDSDCKPICGNGMLDMKEVCEPDPLDAKTPACPTEEACRALSPCLTLNTGNSLCNEPCVRDPKIPEATCERAVCGDRVVQPEESCEPHPLSTTGTCPSDSECKIQKGPCFIANTAADQCSSPCVRDPDAKNCSAGPSCGNQAKEMGEMCELTPKDAKDKCADDAGCKAQNACWVANTGPDRCSHPCVIGASAECKPSVCGDKLVSGKEICEPSPMSAADMKCPTSADECKVKACMTVALNTGDALCTEPCKYTLVPGCMGQDDMDVDVCGDGKKTGKEACDPMAPGAAACPTDDAACDDKDECTTDRIRKAVDPCARVCENTPIASCTMAPPSMNMMDMMPAASCGDGKVTTGEKCDPAASGKSKCPAVAADCDDKDACTKDALLDAALPCQASCSHTAITGCPAQMDPMTMTPPGTMPMTMPMTMTPAPSCGDGMVNGTELCDPMASGAGKCPTSAADCKAPAAKCMVAKFVGAGCNAQCETVAVTAPANGDGCCPPGASSANDNDCAPTEPSEPKAECGDGKREGAEECDGTYTGAACTSEACVMREPTCTSSCKNLCVETKIPCDEAGM